MGNLLFCYLLKDLGLDIMTKEGFLSSEFFPSMQIALGCHEILSVRPRV